MGNGEVEEGGKESREGREVNSGGELSQAATTAFWPCNLEERLQTDGECGRTHIAGTLRQSGHAFTSSGASLVDCPKVTRISEADSV